MQTLYKKDAGAAEMVEKIGHKAVLAYPKFDTQDTFWSYERSLKLYAPPGEFGLPKRLLPPLGMMGLYNHLKPHYDEIVLLDRNVDPTPLEQLINNADHVYIGGMLTQQHEFLSDAEIVKQAGKVLIAGGPIVARDSPLLEIADHLIENEAEMVIDELLLGLKHGNAKKYYKGIFTPAERFFKPDYSSINVQNYAHMALQISRGCPESCEFCDAPDRFGKNYRITPWRDTLAAFQQLFELGWKGPVFLVDDNFIGNPKIALEVLKNLYRIGEQIGFHHPKYTELTLRLADDLPIMQQLREWFRKTGFINGFYGVETPNKAALRETEKHQNLRGNHSLLGKLSFISEQTGAGVMMGMIYGFDNDTNDTVAEFIEFVNASNAPIVMVGLLNALPGTALLERVQSQGRFINSSTRNNSDGVINFIPQNFSVQQAERNFLTILDGIYRPEAYFARVMRHLQLVDPVVQPAYRSATDKVSLLIKILTRQNAALYWRYLPKAHVIAVKRFGFNSTGYQYLIAEYFALCGQYTHFVGQIKAQQQKIAAKRYAPWQQYSWNQLLQSPIKQVRVIEENDSAAIFDRIDVTLQLDYQFSGSRLEVMRYFAEPFITAGLKTLRSESRPAREQFVAVEINAFKQVHRQRPEILRGLNFSLIEDHLTETSKTQPDYLYKIRRLYRKTMAIEQYS